MLVIYIAHWETYSTITSHTQSSKTSTFALRYTSFYPKLYIIPLLSGSSCDPCALSIVKVIWLVTVKTSFIFQNLFQLHNLRRSILVILWLLQWIFAHKEIGWPKYELYPSLSFLRTKNLYFKYERRRRDAMEGSLSPKTSTKMPTRIENVEMN